MRPSRRAIDSLPSSFTYGYWYAQPVVATVMVTVAGDEIALVDKTSGSTPVGATGVTVMSFAFVLAGMIA